MPLDEYRRKRDFARTPEPAGDGPRTPPTAPAEAHAALFPGWQRLDAGHRFCVQMHHASRLHWDLRLELDGVLLSWAVPKGPTLDPAERRLAVHVEDHPLDYGDFEGTIPTGYGAGTVMLWDAGTVRWVRESEADPKATLERGDLKFALAGVKLNGEFALVRTGGRGRGARGTSPAEDAERQWLLIKKRDAAVVPGFDAHDLDISVLTGRSLAEIAAGAPPWAGTAPATATWLSGSGRSEDGGVPHRSDPPAAAGVVGAAAGVPRALVLAAPRRHVAATVQPMLATAASAPFSRAGWLFELKYDGVRVVASLHDRQVTARARSGRDESRRYPELGGLVAALDATDAVVDGEVVALDGEGRASFELLQRRINLEAPAQIERIRREVPAVYVVFDVLSLDGHDLRDLPLRDRKRILRSVLTDSASVRYADHVEDQGEALFAGVAAQGAEGVLGKDAASRYEAGRRSTAWLKVRAWRTQDCAICGFTAGKGGRGDLGALVLGVLDQGRLVHCGQVGSGFDEDTLRALLVRLRADAVDERPLATVRDTVTRATWVRPSLVCSVRHIGWTSAGTLRHPTYRGLREDLTVADCVREPEVNAVDDGVEVALARLAELDPVVDHWDIGGRRLRLTNLDKALWPDGITKRDLIAYYVRAARVMLPHLRDRAVGMQVFPDGIEGKHFWRKRIPDHAPGWIRTWTYTGDRTVTYVLVDEVATLAWMANSAVIDIHPWHSRVDEPLLPDWAVFDLDPSPPATFDDVKEVARLVHAALDHYGLRGLPKVSGQTGIQIYVPLRRGPDQDTVRDWVEEIARAIGSVAPDRVTFDWAVARRSGRLRIDYTQNVVGKTLAAPYSVRPAPGAPVSTPITWEELEDPGLRPDAWTIHTVLDRVAARGDLFSTVLAADQDLPGRP